MKIRIKAYKHKGAGEEGGGGGKGGEERRGRGRRGGEVNKGGWKIGEKSVVGIWKVNGRRKREANKKHYLFSAFKNTLYFVFFSKI